MQSDLKHHLQQFFFTAILFWALIGPASVFANNWSDCFWGGKNEETAYTRPYVAGMSGTLQTINSPDMNLGAPQPGIPVQATSNTQNTIIPQAALPTINSQAGQNIANTNLVGTVGLPATSPNAINLPQAPPGTEIMFVLPTKTPQGDECCDGVKGTPAVAVNVVPPGTPGAIPVAVKTMTVTRPKVERRWTYAPIRTKTDRMVEVVDPRTGQVVRSYCEVDEHHSMLPWPHLEESVTYENVTVKVAMPIRLPDTPILVPQPNPGAIPQPGGIPSTFAPSMPPHSTPYTSNYPTNHSLWNPPTQQSQHLDQGARRTIVVP